MGGGWPYSGNLARKCVKCELGSCGRIFRPIEPRYRCLSNCEVGRGLLRVAAYSKSCQFGLRRPGRKPEVPRCSDSLKVRALSGRYRLGGVSLSLSCIPNAGRSLTVWGRGALGKKCSSVAAEAGLQTWWKTAEGLWPSPFFPPLCEFLKTFYRCNLIYVLASR